jgi:transcriptional regulator with PAS, ATPase and Fis domain
VDLSRNSVACNRSVVVTFKKTIETISADVLKAFLGYPWHGNVREIEHIMEYAFVLCGQNIITFDTEDTPDVEVLHVAQKSCNASVACNTPFSCRL